MMKKILGLLAVGLLAAPLCGHTAMLNFYMSDGSGLAISFQLDSQPGYTALTPNKLFEVYPVSVTVNGTADDYAIEFYVFDEGGGLSISHSGGYLINQVGSQLFTGGPEDATFVTGGYHLTDLGDPNAPSDYPTDLRLSIYPASVAPVPLPTAAWLLLSGLGGLGFVARRRQNEQQRSST